MNTVAAASAIADGSPHFIVGCYIITSFLFSSSSLLTQHSSSLLCVCACAHFIRADIKYLRRSLGCYRPQLNEIDPEKRHSFCVALGCEV